MLVSKLAQNVFKSPWNVYCFGKCRLNLRRIQRIFWRHIDITIVDITQHGIKGLLAWHHFPDRDINLTILRHKGAEHCLKVTAETKDKR